MNRFLRTFTLATLLCVPSLASTQQKHSVYVGVSTNDASKSRARELADSVSDLREQIGKRSNLV
ncbi:MAG: hypothetical protein ACRD1X_20095, partial [Vicinamibacteria bacterium]